jgi:transposase-like protein
VSEERNNKVMSREFLAERDLRIFKMRQSGVAVAEIARRFGVSTSVVNKAVQRQLEKMNREALLAYPEVLRMELERLDNLQSAIWPLTQHRKVTLDDGTEVTMEPDLKAIQSVLSIMDRRSKLLGMEQNSVSVQVDVQSSSPIVATLAGQTTSSKNNELSNFDAENEAKRLLEIMGASGVLPAATVQGILGAGQEIEEAELVEEDE